MGDFPVIPPLTARKMIAIRSSMQAAILCVICSLPPCFQSAPGVFFAEDFPITFFFLLLVCVENIYNGVQLRDSDCPSIQLPRKQTCGYPAFSFITEDAVYSWFPPMSPLLCAPLKRKGQNKACSIVLFAGLRCYLFGEHSGHKVWIYWSWLIPMPWILYNQLFLWKITVV